MAYLAGQLVFWVIFAMVVVGVIWAVRVMRKPRPPLDEDDDGEW
ncbi:hypothetical protein [Mycolicibacterium sp.]